VTGSDRERDVLAGVIRAVTAVAPDLAAIAEAQRERLAEVRAQVDALAPVVAAIADEVAAEALDQRNEALDRLSDRTRAKWEAEARYAALVDKVRALAELGVRERWPPDEWAAGLRTLLEAVR
jgi:hypothetical protein